MSSHLRPVVLESCRNGLRERRQSDINPLSALPPVFAAGPASTQDGSVIPDDNEVSETISPAVNSSLTVVTPAHAALASIELPVHSSEIIVARHYHSSPTIYASEASSPSSSSAPTILESRKPSIMTLSDQVGLENVKLERLKWRLASGYFAYFLCGWGDGVTGTVLPYFMADYHISYMTSSLLYAGSTTGFMFGTFLVESVIGQLGCFDLKKTHWSWIPKTNLFSRVFPRTQETEIGYSPSQARLLALFVSSILHGMFFVMMGSRAGFWVSFGAYSVAAFARSILTTPLNAYFASGPKGSISYAFSLWSLGGVASPLVCQSVISSGVPWFKFYYGSLVLSAINVAFLVLTFRPTANEFLRDRQDAIVRTPKCGSEKWADEASSVRDIEDKSPTSSAPNTPRNEKTLLFALTLPYQWAVCIFALLYCGCETTTQAFMVSYLLGTRHANPNTVGYVTSGFWGGITIGRLVWGHFTSKLGYTQRKFVILGCIFIGLTMQILIWRVKSNIENSISTSIIGLVYGPVFPSCLTLANDILPPKVAMVSMALISLSGSSGAALFPFIAGTISSIDGVRTLVYITIPLASTITCLWALFPSKIPSRPQIV